MGRIRNDSSDPVLFDSDNGTPRLRSQRRRALIIPALLAAESEKQHLRGTAEDKAHRIILKWADLESNGHLADRKETALDADFLLDVFGEALGYQAKISSPDRWNLERQFSVPDGLTADGALGVFTPDAPPSPIAVIELKDAGVNLDRDRSRGRTPVQQCWDYLNLLPDCQWGIVSNFITIRLYHRTKTPVAYEEFSLQRLRDVEEFRRFYCLFERRGLLKPKVGAPRADELLRLTGKRQRDVGDALYDAYSQNRLALIEHLHRKLGRSLDSAIAIAQKLLDRIVFIAFCQARGLLPGALLRRAWKDTPPIPRTKNPRWQNFLDLFHAVDKGHPEIGLDSGYNGGLFRADPEIDNLDLDDSWTKFFKEIGTYDFRDEVNVEVLGHLFEKSVTEIEKIRQGGLFDGGGDSDERSRMPKSAKRKRFGIYYTPPEFTDFIVRQTVEAVVVERFGKLQDTHGVDPDADAKGPSAKKLRAYWRACLDALREVKVCDPACGSGAFLIKAYDVLEEQYHVVISGIAGRDPDDAATFDEQVPDMILGDNLFGVDLSPEAVEITQLALWIRSARRGWTLADLSANVVVGNSLVDDASVHPRAFDWRKRFPAVFDRPQSGFDCVIGNPPWERLKLQEREFFSFSAPKIAEAVSAAKRRTLIAKLEHEQPDLHERYLAAKTDAERVLDHVRKSNRFPLTAKGDINTYMLFAELAHSIVAPTGRVGVLVPSGIATDHTTRRFFARLMDSKALMSLHDFENKLPVFPDVHRSFKFSTLVFGGSKVQTKQADFLFFAREMSDLKDRNRHIPLTAKDIRLFNPNTRTCPIFRTLRDAKITKGIYNRVPILVDKSRKEAGNPWGVHFLRMFDQTNDAELFHTAEDLSKKRYKPKGNRWVKGKSVFLPLYEAKMVQMYDHRAASVVIETSNWFRQGQTEKTSLVSHQNPSFEVQPRWWAGRDAVLDALGDEDATVLLAYKNVTSPTNERTMIAALIPPVGVINSAPLILLPAFVSGRSKCCLLANLNSFVLDYIARQKVGNVNLNYFLVEQFPMLPPDDYAQKCPWNRRVTLERWISDRVLKLTCTAEDMRPFGEACKMKNPVHKWRQDDRVHLMADLDAAYFRLYGVSRDDAEYILSTFTGTARRDRKETGGYRTADLILDAYDELAPA